MEGKVIPDMYQSNLGDLCPSGDGGTIEKRLSGDGAKVYLQCSANGDHWRWETVAEAGLVRSASATA